MHRWIPLARVAREHGLTKGETSYLKCDLLQVGGLAFEQANSVAICSQEHSLQNLKKLGSESESILTKLKLSEKVKPLGGKWGEAKAVILPVPKNFKWTRGDWVLLSREAFPKIKDHEIYLCDLVDAFVAEATGANPIATVIGVEDRSKGAKEAVSLILRDLESQKTFEVPLKSIDWNGWQGGSEPLVVPSLLDWRSLA